MQSLRASIVESVAQTVIGYAVALAAQQWVVFPMFGVRVGWGAGAGIGAAMLAVSFVRQLVIRRVFARG